MEYKTLIDGTKIPVLGLGTWQMGGRETADFSRDKEEIEAVKKAIGLGYTLIDTAEKYGAGHAEELVGEAIKGIGRKKLFIVTKAARDNLSYDNLMNSAKQSLARLHVKYVDLYLIHAPNPKIPLKETMEAMDKLVEMGLTRYIGVSNFSVAEMEEAQGYAKNRIVANQVQYSLMARNKSTYGDRYVNMESEIIPYCQKKDIVVMADRPLHKGLLVENKHPILERLSKKYGKTKAQIALNWLICKKDIIAIPKSSDVRHLKENLGAVGWRLADADVKLLDETEFEDS